MKINKILSFAVLGLFAFGFASCSNEEDDYFSETAGQRLDEAPAKYKSRLTAASNGWAFQYYPTTETSYPDGDGYLMLAKFNTNGSVLIGMNNVFSGSRYGSDESGWEIITDDGPVLTFNTYNQMLHSFSNPDDIPWLRNGTASRPHISVQGTGIGGDYEFIITDAPEDGSYIQLKGKKRGTYSLLTPLEDSVNYVTYLQDINDFDSRMFAPGAPNGLYLTAGSTQYALTESQGFLSFYLVGSDPVVSTHVEPYLITKQKGQYVLRTRSALGLGADGSINVQEFTYDPENDQFIGRTDSTCTITSSANSAIDFINEALASGHQYKITRSGNISSKMKGYLDAANDQLYRYGRTLRPRVTMHVDSLNLIQTADGNITWNAKIMSNSDYYSYVYQKSENGNNLTYTFENAANDLSEYPIDNFSDFAALFKEVLSRQWTVVPLDTKFNYGNIKFTAVDDPDLWFVATFTN